MKRSKFIILIVILFSSFFSCNENDPQEASCDNQAIISNAQFNNATSSIITLNSVFINDDCLIVNYSASGCDGDTWILNVIDSDGIIETSPPERTIRITLFNNEACLAFLTKEVSFDITALQVDGNQVILNIVNSNDSVTYNY